MTIKNKKRQEISRLFENAFKTAAKASTKPSIIFSDFDFTLCHEYTFDPLSNDHLPKIDPNLVKMAQKNCLIIATGRRATNPAIPLLWESGLVPKTLPVITENGGVIVFKDEEKLVYLDLVSPKKVKMIKESRKVIEKKLTSIPDGQKVVYKEGRTMLLVRLQDDEGNIVQTNQSWLAKKIRGYVNCDELQVVNTGSSVTIQDIGINKSFAFRKYLELKNIDRDSLLVIGMGDAQNDREIFEEADLCVGFSLEVDGMVDINIPHGSCTISNIFRTISTFSQRFTSI